MGTLHSLEQDAFKSFLNVTNGFSLETLTWYKVQWISLLLVLG
jgi:hypothetical protein